MRTLQERLAAVQVRGKEYTYTGRVLTEDEDGNLSFAEGTETYYYRKPSKGAYEQALAEFRRRQRQLQGDAERRRAFEEAYLEEAPAKKSELIEAVIQQEGLVEEESWDSTKESVTASLEEAFARLQYAGQWVKADDVVDKVRNLLGEAQQMEEEEYRTTPAFDGEDEADMSVISRHAEVERQKVRRQIAERRKELTEMTLKQLREQWSSQSWEARCMSEASRHMVHCLLVNEVFSDPDCKLPVLSNPDSIEEQVERVLPEFYQFLIASHADFNQGMINLEDLAFMASFRGGMGYL